MVDTVRMKSDPSPSWTAEKILALARGYQEAAVLAALFAINMLVATPGGGTFTFGELREDLESAGFVQAEVARQDEGMNSIVLARKTE